MLSTGFVLLLTRNSSNTFSNKVIKTAAALGCQTLTAAPKMKALKEVTQDIQAIIVDLEEVGSLASYFLELLRKVYPAPPILLAFPERLLQSQFPTHFLTYSFAKNISPEELSTFLTRSLEFNQELRLATNEFNKLYEKRGVKNLEKSELTQAIHEIQKEAYSSPVFSALWRREENQGKEPLQKSSFSEFCE